MGNIKQGVLGGFSGTVGTVIGFIRNGRAFMRGKPLSFDDANTPKQIAWRNRFAACSQISELISLDIIKPIWNRSAVDMTGYNFFIQKNVKLFAADGTIADYANFKISVGDLPLPTGIVVANSVAGNGAIVINWTDNTGFDIAVATDRVRVVVLQGNVPTVITGLTFTRSAGQATMQLPYLTGEVVHVYVFFQNEDGSVYSDSFHSPLTIS